MRGTGQAVPDGLQRLLAAIGAILSAPLVAMLAIMVRLEDGSPSFYVAPRVGEHGRPFGLWKLRTMRQGAADEGPGISTIGDPRVTRVGRLLRGWRLDELPQLWNVARGEMRLVGPRPEDPRYIDLDDALHRRVVAARPGITGLAQLTHTDEAARLDVADPERSYRSTIQPAKLALDAAYLDCRSPALDVWIMVKTISAMMGRPPSAAVIESRLRRVRRT